MKPGDLVTPILLPAGESFFCLWDRYDWSRLADTAMMDKFLIDEIGIVLESATDERSGREYAHVLSPRGISGWISKSNLREV